MTRQIAANEPAPPSAELTGPKSALRRVRALLQGFPEIRPIIVLVVFVMVVAAFYPRFLSVASIANITQQASFFGIIALGMVFMLALGEIDLSVAGNYAFTAVVAALLASGGLNVWIAAAIAVAVGAALGAVNAMISNVLRVPIIVISLGTLTAYRGLALIFADGSTVSMPNPTSPFFTVLGGFLGGISIVTYLFVLLAIVLSFVFTRSSFGFATRAVGSNPHAARISGYPIARIKVMVAALVGALCGVAGALSFAFFGAVDPSLGGGYELLVIAAAVIGGTGLSGGRGSVIGALIGALIVSVINASLISFGVSINYAGFVTGLVIIGAVALDSIFRQRGARL